MIALADRPSSRVPWAVAIFGLVAALLGIVAAVTFGSALSRERKVADDLEVVAREFTAALLTYDSSDLEASRKRVRPLVTDKFFANYESTLNALATVNSRAAGRATEVLLSEPHDEKAAVVVVTESRAETANGPRASTGAYLRLDLVRSGGKWRVDSVLELAPGQLEGASPPPDS